MAIDILLKGATMGIISLIAEKRAVQVALLIALALLLVRICIVVRRRQRVEEALLDGLCPDCGYECGLDGTGPPLCPECGGVWPLVPPDPTPRRATGATELADRDSAPDRRRS